MPHYHVNASCIIANISDKCHTRAVDKVGFGVNTQSKLAKYPIIFESVGNKTQLKWQKPQLVQNG